MLIVFPLTDFSRKVPCIAKLDQGRQVTENYKGIHQYCDNDDLQKRIQTLIETFVILL